MSFSRNLVASLAFVAAAFATSARAQAPAPAPAAPPPFATTKVEGTDNVYIFRYGGHQAMFIVTKDGVIATDPVSLRRSAQVYIDEIKKVTPAPIKYVIYSHSHYDHIAGGEPFKKLGARFIAHKNTTARLKQLKPADVVIPDESVGDKKVITLGGTSLELNYVGKNHGDNTLVMRLPKEKIIFTVDWLPLQAVQFRVMADTYLPETFEGIKKVLAMDWDRMISGHPGPGGRQIGTKDDVRNTLSYLEDLSAAVKAQVDQGRSYDQAMEAIKLPKYESFGGYGPFLKMNIERFYDFHNRGI